MNVRADLTELAVVTPDEWQWVDSPQAGVTRVMLDRVGDEVAVATSFVRYAEGSTFPTHEHALGEEFLVLEGEFGDDYGRFPEGTYIRNPPGTSHAPFSEPGCLIWVKLRQFDEVDLTQFDVPLDLEMGEGGTNERLLHEHKSERVREVVLAEGETVSIGNDEAAELLVLEGEVVALGRDLPRWSWLRVPAGETVTLAALAHSRLFTKTRPIYREA